MDTFTRIGMSSTLVLLSAFGMALSSGDAHAVYTKRCPESISMELVRSNLNSDSTIRELPRHVKYDEEMFNTVLQSRDRLESLFSTHWQSGSFSIVERANGKCVYRSNEKSVGSNLITLYTTGGKDYLKQEIALLYRFRPEERFALLSELASYSTEGLELNHSVETEVFTTIKYGCYDRTCIAEALIGTADVDVR